MNVVKQVARALKLKGYRGEIEHTSKAAKVVAVGPDGDEHDFCGTLRDAGKWTDGLFDHAAEAAAQEAWEKKYHNMTQADVEAALELEEGSIEIPSLVKTDTPTTVEAVPGKAAVVSAQEKLERVRAMTLPPPEVEPFTQEVNIRAVLAEAEEKRVYARIKYVDRQGVISERDILVQGLTATYAFANCDTRAQENLRAFVVDYRRRQGMVRLPGRARRRFSNEVDVRRMAYILANRKFILEQVLEAELTDTPVPAPGNKGAPWVCPTDDYSGRTGKVWQCANPEHLVETGHWKVL